LSGHSSGVERNLAKVEVEGSNPFARSKVWGHSSVGRAPALQAGGHRFEPVCLHHVIMYMIIWWLYVLFSRSELIKKLKYRSANRGCKELDIIIGNFAVSMLDEMSDQDLLTYQQLLEIEDNDFYNLFVQHINGQQSDSCPVLKQIVDFAAKHRG